jgi:uncharacterized membrane protein
MELRPDLDLLLALAGGIVIAATCGLRAFLPLFALGLAGRLGGLTLEPSVRWLQSDVALVALGVATAAEVLGDKVPMVDHALDMVGSVVRPVAGVLGSFVVLQAWPQPWPALIAIMLGGLALGIQSAKAKARIGSTVLSLGHANPLLSLAEDLFAAAGAALAVFVPAVALVLTAVLLWLLLGRRRARAHRMA